MNANITESIKQHLENIESREAQIVDLLKKITVKLVELNTVPASRSVNEDPLDEYDFVYLLNNGSARWVWKHFLRGARSSRSFSTREEAVADARRDALLHAKFSMPTRVRSG